MSLWHRAHTQTRWFVRWPVKLALASLVLAAVMWPHPTLFPRWVERLRNMNALIDPTHPGLAPLEARARWWMRGDESPKQLLAIVEQVVHDHLPYAWDWDTWGVFDYWPTVDEALRLGREDCDGRAVVAASLLRRMGQDARLESDLLHVWVKTSRGATMGPTSESGTFASDDSPSGTGTVVVVNRDVLKNLARGLSYGVAAFPLRREAVLLAAIALLTMHPWSGWRRRVVGCLLLVTGLALIRSAGLGAAAGGDALKTAIVIGGVVAALLGWLMLAIKAGGGRHRSPEALPE